jgi:hypothetical protein
MLTGIWSGTLAPSAHLAEIAGDRYPIVLALEETDGSVTGTGARARRRSTMLALRQEPSIARRAASTFVLTRRLTPRRMSTWSLRVTSHPTRSGAASSMDDPEAVDLSSGAFRNGVGRAARPRSFPPRANRALLLATAGSGCSVR